MKNYIQARSEGLNESVLHLIRQLVGIENAMPRDILVSRINGNYMVASERAVRQAINDLRHEGYPICSTGGEGGGYWWAANPKELTDYHSHQVYPIIADLSEQIKAQLLYQAQHAELQPHLIEA
jgi:hypothetical protein